VLLDPIALRWPIWTDNQLVSHVDAQWNIPYEFAVLAHRVPVGPEWQDKRTMENPQILEFMKKVSFSTYPQFYSGAT